jgi:hypothetical protein
LGKNIPVDFYLTFSYKARNETDKALAKGAKAMEKGE